MLPIKVVHVFIRKYNELTTILSNYSFTSLRSCCIAIPRAHTWTLIFFIFFSFSFYMGKNQEQKCLIDCFWSKCQWLTFHGTVEFSSLNSGVLYSRCSVFLVKVVTLSCRVGYKFSLCLVLCSQGCVLFVMLIQSFPSHKGSSEGWEVVCEPLWTKLSLIRVRVLQ